MLRSGRPRGFAALLVATTIAGAVAGAGAAYPIAATALADHPAGVRGVWRVRGRLDGDPRRAGTSWKAPLQVGEILVDGEWKPWPLRVRSTIYEPVESTGWRAGDRFETFLSFRADRPARNPLLSPRAPLRASGADLRASLKSFRQLRTNGYAGARSAPAPALRSSLLSGVRAGTRRRIERLFGAHAPLLKALLLGERDEVPAGLLAALARTGLIHLIAISGLHVSIVMSAMFGLLRLAGLARPGAALLCLLALPLLYGFVVPRPAVARACLMAALVLVGIVGGRRTSALNGLAFATLALTVADPWVVRDAGFQLSTAATAAILLLFRAPTWQRRIPAFVAASLAVSGAAAIGVAPVMASMTHRLTPVSIPLNLAAVPAMTLAVASAIGSLAFDAAGSATISRPLAWLARGVLDLLLALVEMVDRAVPATPVPSPAVPWILPACLAVGCSIALWGPAAGIASGVRRGLVRTALAACCALAFAGLMTAMRTAAVAPVEAFRLVAFDIGQGDALLVETPGLSVMIDTGGSLLGDYDPGTSILAPTLRARGIRRLDAVAITHLHADHAGGLGGLLREIGTRAVWVPSFNPHQQAGVRLLRAAADSPVVTLAAGQRLGDRACSWRVLHPSAAGLTTGGAGVSNDGSLVLSLRCGGRSLLLTGDTGTGAEAAYLDDVATSGSVLKSAHHGSITSSSPRLLDAVAARHVVVSAGWRNRFGLPDGEVLERYRRRRMAVYRTDRDGAVTVSAGRRIRVRGERWSAGRGRYRVGGWLD